MAGSFPKYVSFFLLLCLGLFAGCKHDIPVQPAPENPGNPADTGNPGNGNPGTGNPGGPAGQPCDPTKIYFQRDILPILLSNCTMSGCHNANDREDGVVLDSYSNVMNSADVRPGDAGDSDLYEVLVENDPDKRMPYRMAPLPQAQRNLIRDWINQGAKNETCDPNAGLCDSTNVTFTAVIKPIIQTNCVGCHNQSLASGGHNFTTHTGLAAVANNGKLVGAISHAPGFKAMPQGGKLNDCQIAQIRKWVNLGALNN